MFDQIKNALVVGKIYSHYGFISLILLIFCAVVFFAYSFYVDHIPVDEDLIVLSPSFTHLKERPKNPEGMFFPYRDTTIYDAFESKDGKDPALKGLDQATIVEQTPELPEVFLKQQEEKFSKMIHDDPLIISKDVQHKSSHRFKVRLAIFKKPYKAQEFLSYLTQKHPKIFSSLSLFIEKENVNRKLSYHLYVGYFFHKNQIDQLCYLLKKAHIKSLCQGQED